MMNAVRLTAASADLNVMGKASLHNRSALAPSAIKGHWTYPHSSMESPGNFIVLLKSRAAAQNLGKPELANCTLHVANLALGRSRSLDPLRWLAANTANHVRMRECFGRPLLRLNSKSRGDRLGDTGVKGRGTTWDNQVAVGLVASTGTALAVPGPRPLERGVRV